MNKYKTFEAWFKYKTEEYEFRTHEDINILQRYKSTFKMCFNDAKKNLLDKQRVKDAIGKSMKESGGYSADIESTDPSEIMAALLIEKLGLNES